MSILRFETLTPKGMVDYNVTWKLGNTEPKNRELRAECTNVENDLNFQFKIIHEDRANVSRLYFRCRNKVRIMYIKFIQKDILGQTLKTGDLLFDNYMVTKPDMWLYITVIDRINNSSIHLNITIFNEKLVPSVILESQLCNDFENLLHSGSFSDAIMKSADGEEYKVHKAFLTSRSPVLKAHFEHNTKESVTNILESPLESEVLNEVINFIYTDRAPNLTKMPEKLLAAANFYQLDRLKGLSEEALDAKLTADNALETLQLAELYSCENLKESTLQYIKDKANLVTKTEAWAKMNSPELIKSLFEYMAEQNK